MGDGRLRELLYFLGLSSARGFFLLEERFLAFFGRSCKRRRVAGGRCFGLLTVGFAAGTGYNSSP